MASIFFLLISSILLVPSATSTEDLVSTTCGQTPFSDICLSTLRSDPRCGSSNLKGLAVIALSQTIAKATETKSRIHHLLKSHIPNQTEYEFKCLTECLAEYNEALDNLHESHLALRHDSWDTVNSGVAAAQTDAETCENGFLEEGLPENPSPLTEDNQFFSKLCSNFLAITTLLL